MYFDWILFSISEFSKSYFKSLFILFSSNNAFNFESLVNLNILVIFPVLEFCVSKRSNGNVANISIKSHRLWAYLIAICL